MQHCQSRGAACREGLCQPAGDCTKFLRFSNSNWSNGVLLLFPTPGAGRGSHSGNCPSLWHCGRISWLQIWTIKHLIMENKSWCPHAAWHSLCLLSPELTHPNSPCFILSLLPNPEFLKDFLAGKPCLLRVFSFLPLPAHCLEQQLLTYFCLLIAAAIWILIPESRCIEDAQHTPGPGHLSPRPVFSSPLNPGTP